MISPKTYLDNLEGCKFRGVIRVPGQDDCHFYTYKKHSIGYSHSWDDDDEYCHVVSFDAGRQGDWFFDFMMEMVNHCGKASHYFRKNGIAYFMWKESKNEA